MAFQHILYVLLSFFSVAVLLVLAAYAFGRRRTQGAMAFGFLMVAACEWKLTYGLGLIFRDLQTKLFLHNLEYLGVAVVSVAWLVFTLQYTGLQKWLSWRKSVLLGALPLLTMFLVWTNGAHGLVWASRKIVRSGPFATISMDHGPWFWVFAAYSYLLVLLGTLLLVAQLLRSSPAYRKQTAAVLLGVVVLWAGNAAYLLQLGPDSYLNPTLLSFPLTGLLFAWSLFRFRLLDVVPVSRDILIERIGDGVIVLDELDRVVDFNRAAERILGRRAPKLLWHPVVEVLPGLLPEFFAAPGSSVPLEGTAGEEARTKEFRSIEEYAEEFDLKSLEVKIGEGEGARYYERTLSTLDSRDVWPKGYLILLRDVTERRWLERRLEHQALHDSLTNLPNRNLLMDRLSHALERIAGRTAPQATDQNHYEVTLLLLDLDNFKAVNDSLGHEAGDALLTMVAQRIRECLRPEDTPARLGGDEFVVLIEDTPHKKAILVAERISRELDRSFQIQGHELFMSASIGVAGSDPSQLSAVQGEGEELRKGEDLLKEADTAMYRAKEKGKDCLEVFEEWMDSRADKRLKLSNDLRRAVEREEFILHYQPIAHLATGKIEGFEALLRWKHPKRGLLFPDEFIHVAEESGFMVPLGRWVLRQASLQGAQWHQEYPDVPPPSVSVNLSPRQFGRAELIKEVEEIVGRAGLDPHFLKLEITENVAMKDAPLTVETFERLRDFNVEVVLDDFGTGYSSLGYLTRFPVDALKIDRSIVGGLDQDPKKAAVARAIVTLTHSLNHRVVAEGIETRGQLEYLRGLGCELGQGNLFWEPLLPEAAIRLYLQTQKRRPVWALPGR